MKHFAIRRNLSLTNLVKDILDGRLKLKAASSTNAANVPAGSAFVGGTGEVSFVWNRNGHPHMAASLARVLVAEAFQRTNEVRASQIPGEFHA